MAKDPTRTPNPVFRCTKCERDVAGVFRGEGHGYDEGTSGAYFLHYVLSTCPDCGEVHLLEYSGEHAYYSSGQVIDEWNDAVVVYPADAKLNLDASIPRHVGASYVSAHQAFHVLGDYTASGLLSRRTLELLCKDKGEASGALQSKLDRLKEKELIDAKVHCWGQFVVRPIGNEAAHDVESVSRDDALSALEFTRAILEHVYTFEAAYEAFKNRRDASSGRTH